VKERPCNRDDGLYTDDREQDERFDDRRGCSFETVAERSNEEIDREKRKENDPVDRIYSPQTLPTVVSQFLGFAYVISMSMKDHDSAQNEKEIDAASAKVKVLAGTMPILRQ
jgi:hypothetical protein